MHYLPYSSPLIKINSRIFIWSLREVKKTNKLPLLPTKKKKKKWIKKQQHPLQKIHQTNKPILKYKNTTHPQEKNKQNRTFILITLKMQRIWVISIEKTGLPRNGRGCWKRVIVEKLLGRECHVMQWASDVLISVARREWHGVGTSLSIKINVSQAVKGVENVTQDMKGMIDSLESKRCQEKKITRGRCVTWRYVRS